MRLKIFFSSIIFLFLSVTSFSQENTFCKEVSENLAKMYKEKKYNQALDLFKKSLVCKELLSANNYYDGACFASLVGDNKFAVEYFNKAIALGFNNLNHLNNDSDLDNIRNEVGFKKGIANILGISLDNLINIEQLKTNNFNDLVPYKKDEKWSWLDKKTLKSVIGLIFDYTTFKRSNGLFFSLGNKDYVVDSKGKISSTKHGGYFSNDVIEETGVYDVKVTPDADLQGFKIGKAGNVIEHSDRFKYVTAIKTLKGFIGKVKTIEGNYNLISQDGKKIKGFETDFKKLTFFYSSNHELGFIGKKEGASYYKIYNNKGKSICNEKIQSFDFFDSNGLLNKGVKETYLNYNINKFIILKIDDKFKIYDTFKNKLISSKAYDKVIDVDGPAKDNDLTKTIYDSGLTKTYFLVRRENHLFFIDTSGKEYFAK